MREVKEAGHLHRGNHQANLLGSVMEHYTNDDNFQGAKKSKFGPVDYVFANDYIMSQIFPFLGTNFSEPVDTSEPELPATSNATVLSIPINKYVPK